MCRRVLVSVVNLRVRGREGGLTWGLESEFGVWSLVFHLSLVLPFGLSVDAFEQSRLPHIAVQKASMQTQ